jgi:hypothetical protein
VRAASSLSSGARRVRRHDGTAGRAAFTGGGVACCSVHCALSAFFRVRAASSPLLGSDLCPSCLPLLGCACTPATFTWRGPPVIRVTRPLLTGPGLTAAAPVDRSINSAPASATVTDTVVVLSDVTLEESRARRSLLDFGCV